MTEVQSLDDLLRASEPEPPKRKLLVVDDKPEVVDGLRHSRLARTYQILSSSNGKEGLARLGEDCEIGVVLLDMLMPVMTGEEFLKALRGAPGGYNKCTRVIVYTAFAGRGVNEAEILRQYGPIRFLTKTTDPAVVEAEIRNAYTEHDTELTVRLELQRTQERLLHTSKMNALATFAAGVFHHFKNRLSPIDSVAQELSDRLTQVLELRSRVVQELSPQQLRELDQMLGLVTGRAALQRDDERREALSDAIAAATRSTAPDVAARSSDLADLALEPEEIVASKDLLAQPSALAYLTRAGLLGRRIAALRGGVHDLTSIVRNLLLFSKPAAAPIEQVTLTDFLLEQARHLSASHPEAHYAISSDFTATAPVLAVQRDALSQIVLNLLTNSIEAMPSGGTIGLACWRQDDAGTRRLCFSISDTGAGIRRELLPRIFEPFFTTKGSRGTGIGLAVAYGLVTALGGTITCDSREGAGTTFVVKLPGGDSD